MILSVAEIFDIIVMSFFLGLIFADVFRIPRTERLRYEPLTKDFRHRKPEKRVFNIDINDFKNAVMIIAPAIILHELGHKFVAIAFGLEAVFHAAYFWLFLGLILKLIGSNFIIFVPAFVEIAGEASHFKYALVSVAGPLVNLILWLVSAYALKKNLVRKKYKIMLLLSSRINMFLFIFNMLPIPPFDGFKFVSNLWMTIF